MVAVWAESPQPSQRARMAARSPHVRQMEKGVRQALKGVRQVSGRGLSVSANARHPAGLAAIFSPSFRLCRAKWPRCPQIVVAKGKRGSGVEA